MPQRRPRFELLLPVLLFVVGACSGPVTLQSRSMSEAPSVDGALDDWGGTLTYLSDEPVSMGAAPTDSLLYVALVIQDRALVRSVVANGLRVWIDPSGGQQRTYGIRYPLGLRAQRAENRGTSSKASGRSDRPRPASAIEQLNLSKLEVVWHDSTRRRIPAHFSSGLRAKARLDPGSLVYELAIPVGAGERSGHRHGLRASLGRTVSIGLKTPEPEDSGSDASNPGTTGVPSVTGRPGRGRPRRGRRGRRRRAIRNAQQAEVPTLDLWTKVVTREK